MSQKDVEQVFKIRRNKSGSSLLKRRTWFDVEGASTTSEVIQGDAVEERVSSVPAIDWAKTQIPEDVLKNHPLYKQVVGEAAQRRIDQKNLREQLAKLSDEKTAPVDSTKTPVQSDTPVTLETVNKLLADELSKVNLKAQQDALLIQFKVPTEDQEIWRDANIEAMTKRLQAAFGGPLKQGNAGNGAGNDDPYSDIRARVRAGISGKGPNPGAQLYTPETQRRLGGGIVTN